MSPQLLDNNSRESAQALSFNSVKKHFQDGVSFVKDEILDIYDRAGSCINKMVLPVNNFLKDLTQIENELHLEHTKECIGAGVFDFNHSFAGKLEENY
jgi:hypothetical protein